MAWPGLRSLVRDLNFSIHGVAATIRRPPPYDAVETTVIWLPHLPQDVPSGASLRREEPFRVMAIRRDAVPVLPTKTKVEVAEHEDDAVTGWIVDGFERIEADHYRAIVIPDRAYVAP